MNANSDDYQISEFFRAFVLANRPKRVTIHPGATFYRGARYSINNFMGEFDQNRFFSRSRSLAINYASVNENSARSDNVYKDKGQPYIIKATLYNTIILYDIEIPLIYVVAAKGVYDLNIESRYIGDQYQSESAQKIIKSYAKLINRDNIRNSAGGNKSYHVWQKDNLLSYINAILGDGKISGYQSEISNEELFTSDTLQRNFKFDVEKI
jgi:hypothetical protein